MISLSADMLRTSELAGVKAPTGFSEGFIVEPRLANDECVPIRGFELLIYIDDVQVFILCEV